MVVQLESVTEEGKSIRTFWYLAHYHNCLTITAVLPTNNVVYWCSDLLVDNIKQDMTSRLFKWHYLHLNSDGAAGLVHTYLQNSMVWNLGRQGILKNTALIINMTYLPSLCIALCKVNWGECSKTYYRYRCYISSRGMVVKKNWAPLVCGPQVYINVFQCTNCVKCRRFIHKCVKTQW